MKHYKTIIRYLREYKEYLESSTYSLEYKRSHYSRTCGLVLDTFKRGITIIVKNALQIMILT